MTESAPPLPIPYDLALRGFSRCHESNLILHVPVVKKNFSCASKKNVLDKPSRKDYLCLMGRKKKTNGLKFLREKAGMSKVALAEKSGLTVKTIQNIELRDMKPTLNTLESLAKALEVPVEWLI